MIPNPVERGLTKARNPTVRGTTRIGRPETNRNPNYITQKKLKDIKGSSFETVFNTRWVDVAHRAGRRWSGRSNRVVTTLFISSFPDQTTILDDA
jgi:hypothetical protein